MKYSSKLRVLKKLKRHLDIMYRGSTEMFALYIIHIDFGRKLIKKWNTKVKLQGHVWFDNPMTEVPIIFSDPKICTIIHERYGAMKA